MLDMTDDDDDELSCCELDVVDEGASESIGDDGNDEDNTSGELLEGILG